MSWGERPWHQELSARRAWPGTLSVKEKWAPSSLTFPSYSGNPQATGFCSLFLNNYRHLKMTRPWLELPKGRTDSLLRLGFLAVSPPQSGAF